MGSMSWDKLLNNTRLGGRPPKSELGRSPFHSDHDKVIFSGASESPGENNLVVV